VSRYGLQELVESRVLVAFVVMCLVPFLVEASGIYIANSPAARALLQVGGLPHQMTPDFFAVALVIQGTLAFLLTAWVAPVLVSPDLVNGALPLYLCRPFSRAEYVLGRFGVPGYTAYCATKHGVIGFTRALALELAPQQITVNALCPGWVDTEMAQQGMQQGAATTGQTFEQFRKSALGAVPIKRIIQPEEVAALVAFLASPAASAITGQTYNICGGQTMD